VLLVKKGAEPQPVGWITVAEVIRALHVLEPKRPITRDQLHYWDARAVVPVRRAKNGSVLLYSTDDVALVRVIVRLVATQAIPQHITAALRYLRVPIRNAFREKTSPQFLWIDDRGIGAVVGASQIPAGAIHVVDLQDCWRGSSRAMRAELQKRRAHVWDGWRHVATKDLVAA